MYKNYVSPEEKDIARDEFDPRVLQIGFEHNSPGWYNLEHSHKSCELIYLLKGRESLVALLSTGGLLFLLKVETGSIWSG